MGGTPEQSVGKISYFAGNSNERGQSVTARAIEFHALSGHGDVLVSVENESPQIAPSVPEKCGQSGVSTEPHGQGGASAHLTCERRRASFSKGTPLYLSRAVRCAEIT